MKAGKEGAGHALTGSAVERLYEYKGRGSLHCPVHAASGGQPYYPDEALAGVSSPAIRNRPFGEVKRMKKDHEGVG